MDHPPRNNDWWALAVSSAAAVVRLPLVAREVGGRAKRQEKRRISMWTGQRLPQRCERWKEIEEMVENFLYFHVLVPFRAWRGSRVCHLVILRTRTCEFVAGCIFAAMEQEQAMLVEPSATNPKTVVVRSGWYSGGGVPDEPLVAPQAVRLVAPAGLLSSAAS